MSKLILLVYSFGIACFHPVWLGDISMDLSKDECRNICTNLDIEGRQNSLVICSNEHNNTNATGWKLANRFNLKECKEGQKSSGIFSADDYWMKLQRNSNGKFDVEIFFCKAKIDPSVESSMNLIVNNIKQELRQGGFLIDLIEKYSILSQGNESPSTESPKGKVTTKTSIDTTTMTIASTPAPILLRPFKLAQPVTNGSTIAIHAKVDDQAKSFLIRLLHDASEYHPLIGATLLEINVSFVDKHIHWQAYSNKKAYGERRIPNHFPFVAGQEFECLMTIMQTDIEIENVAKVEKRIQIEVKVNDQKLGDDFIGNQPIWALNWMQIEGDIKLLETPNITFVNDTSIFKLEFKHLLYNGDFFCIRGKVITKNFRLYLLLGASEYIDNNIVENNVMRLTYDRDDEKGTKPESSDQSKLKLEKYLIETKRTAYPHVLDRKERWRYWGGTFTRSLFDYNDSITIKIEMIWQQDQLKKERLNYNITFVGTKLRQIITESLSANWLTVESLDDFVLNPSDVPECDGARQKELPGNILQLYPDKLLEKGDQIVVAGEVENAELIEIFLFREALEWHRYIGQTVLRVQFKRTNFTFNCYIYNDYDVYNMDNNKWWVFPAEGNATNSGNLTEPLVANRTFELKIMAEEKDVFVIAYEGVELRYNNSTLPIWAAQYVVVNGLKVPSDGMPNLVTIERATE